jgi:acyl carrier protein
MIIVLYLLFFYGGIDMSFKKEIKDIVVKTAKIDGKIANENEFYSRPLPIDSMLAIEIMATLEKKFDIEIPEEDLFKFDKLDNIVEIVSALITAKSSIPAVESI